MTRELLEHKTVILSCLVFEKGFFKNCVCKSTGFSFEFCVNDLKESKLLLLTVNNVFGKYEEHCLVKIGIQRQKSYYQRDPISLLSLCMVLE